MVLLAWGLRMTVLQELVEVRWYTVTRIRTVTVG
jgi:hypothetical protein